MTTTPDSGIADQTIRGFLEALGAKVPTPGGGAAAGLVGAIGAALGRMVVSYSAGKKSLAAHEPLLREALDALLGDARELVRLADADAAAYGLVNELSRLPESDERRQREWAGAARAGVDVPLAVMNVCVTMLGRLETLCGASNPHLRSDLAIAAVLAEAGTRSAAWNVVVNVPNLPEAARREALARSEELQGRARQAAERIERRCEAGW